MPFVNPWAKTTCPYCFNPFYLGECEIVGLPTENSGFEPPILAPRPTGMRRLKKRIWLDHLGGNYYTSKLAKRRCPTCAKLLPYQIESMSNLVIGMVGDTFSGKSTYVTALINEIQSRNILDSMGCTEAMLLPESKDRYIRKFYEPLILRREKLEKSTPSSLGDIIEPLICVLVFRHGSGPFQSVKRVNLILFDTAGEDLTKRENLAQISAYVRNAAGLIFLVDPLAIAGISEEIPHHLRVDDLVASHFLLAEVTTLIQMQYNLLPGDPVPIPIALTLAKADILRFLPDFRGSAPVCFTEADYSAGYNQQDMKTVDDEVRELLRRYDGNALLRASQAYTDAGFFAVSATGSSPQDDHYPVVKPLRCIDPLVWLLAKLGVIQS